MNDKIRGVDCNGEYIHDSDLECKAMNDSEVFKIAEFVINSDEIGDKEEAISTSHKMARWILDHKWRRVEDELPEKNGEYLIMERQREQYVAQWDGQTWADTVNYESIENVSLWQPLPQPPEGE